MGPRPPVAPRTDGRTVAWQWVAWSARPQRETWLVQHRRNVSFEIDDNRERKVILTRDGWILLVLPLYLATNTNLYILLRRFESKKTNRKHKPTLFELEQNQSHE